MKLLLEAHRTDAHLEVSSRSTPKYLLAQEQQHQGWEVCVRRELCKVGQPFHGIPLLEQQVFGWQRSLSNQSYNYIFIGD